MREMDYGGAGLDMLRMRGRFLPKGCDMSQLSAAAGEES